MLGIIIQLAGIQFQIVLAALRGSIAPLLEQPAKRHVSLVLRGSIALLLEHPAKLHA
jgi:hypothetical protein